jgi:hypothetical protein
MFRTFWNKAFHPETHGLFLKCMQTKEKHGVTEFQKTVMQVMNATGLHLCETKVIMDFYAFFE